MGKPRQQNKQKETQRKKKRKTTTTSYAFLCYPKSNFSL